MNPHIEICGVPGSGKTSAYRALLAALAPREPGVVGREEAVTRCLRRRPDGLIKNAIKHGPEWVWKRFMSSDYAMSELRAFMAEHTALATRVLDAMTRYGFSTRDRDIVLGAFFKNFAEYELVRVFLRADETFVMDEGHAHRAYTLFGYAPGPELPAADICAYVGAIPRPRAVLRIRTAAERCAARLAVRKAAPYQFPIRLADLTVEQRIARLDFGGRCLDAASDELARLGVDVYTIDNNGSPDELIPQIEAAAERLAASRT